MRDHTPSHGALRTHGDRLARSAVLGASVLLATLTAPLYAQELFVPRGAEFRVNSYTPGNQLYPSVRSAGSGDFVVVWEGRSPSASYAVIFSQRYASSGDALGGELQVTTSTTLGFLRPALSRAADGKFVVVWQSSNPEGDDTIGIRGQRYSSDGDPLGGELFVNTTVTGYRLSPSVSSDADGDFVVVWRGDGQGSSLRNIFGRRFLSSGLSLGGEFRINSYDAGSVTNPVVSSDADGDFVVAWQNEAQDGNSVGVFGQSFLSNGAPRGSELRVNTFTLGAQRYPSISSDADGDFVVVWEGLDPDSGNSGIFGQRFQSSGSALGDEFRVGTATIGGKSAPSVSVEGNGDFTVVWGDGYSQYTGGVDVIGQRYLSSGEALGGELRINSYTLGRQEHPSVSADADGGFVIVWSSNGQDGSERGIFGQRFGQATATPTFTSTLTPTFTPTLTPSITPSITPTFTPSTTPSTTLTATATPPSVELASGLRGPPGLFLISLLSGAALLLGRRLRQAG